MKIGFSLESRSVKPGRKAAAAAGPLRLKSAEEALGAV
jgi:hypothetical protein